MARGPWPRSGVRTRLPVVFRRVAEDFQPTDIEGLALWLDASASGDLFTTDAGPVTAVSSPTEISGCALWLDGADSSAASMTLDGSAVSAWRDKSGNGRDFTASGSARPTRTTNGLNGRSVVTFDGTDDQLTNPTNIVGQASVTMFAVAYRQTGVFGGFISSITGADSSPALLIENTNLAVRGYGQFSSTAFGAFSGPAVLCGRVSAGATEIYTDGLVRDSDAVAGSLNPATTTAIGTYRQAAANYLNGYIAEIVVYNTALSPVDRARVEAYLAAKWGITGVHAPATAANDPVGYWRDRSGNGRHLTQATSAARPSLLTSGISSRPALRFDGTDDNIWRQPGLTSDDLSLLMVYQVDSLTGGVIYDLSHQGDVANSQAQNLTGFVNGLALQVSANGTPIHQMDITRAFVAVDVQGRSGNAGDVTAGTPALSSASAAYSATASSIRKQGWINGRGLPGFARFNAGGWSHITLGCRRNNQNAGGINSPSVFLNGRIAEVLAYSRYLPDADRRRLELYLARKWSVTLAGAPTVANADAQDWIDRVYGNGGTVSASTAAAVNDFCSAIDSEGIRDRFFRLNLFAGTGLNACLVPLYVGPTSLGIRFGGTTDTNVGPFVAGDYAETGASGGLTGNGTSKYLDTGFPMNTLPSTTSGHAAVYCRNRSSSTAFHGMVGVGLAAGNGFGVATDGTVYAQWGAFANVSNTANGLIVASRTSATSLTAYVAGSSIATNTTSVTPTASTLNAAVFVSRNSTVGHTFFDPRTYGFYSIGTGLSAADVASLTSAVNAFQVALGRA